MCWYYPVVQKSTDFVAGGGVWLHMHVSSLWLQGESSGLW